MKKNVQKNRKVIALIPARGGSKGIPHKNICDLCGKPLIAYSILAALEAKKLGVIDDVIVSTDDSEIARISSEYGAYVPFVRPRELSTDKSKSVDCMIHAMEWYRLNGVYYDDIVLLQPTSPLRISEDIVKSITIYNNSNKKSLISCYKEESISEYNSYHIRDGNVVPLNKDHNRGNRRQDIEPLYVRNGAIFITDVEYMMERKMVISDIPAIYVMPIERSINIDTLYDMREAEWIMNNNEFK